MDIFQVVTVGNISSLLFHLIVQAVGACSCRSHNGYISGCDCL